MIEGKYGWYVCDRETFLKIKRLHREFWEDLRREGRLRRWKNKQPQNRGAEPQGPILFGPNLSYRSWGRNSSYGVPLEFNQIHRLDDQKIRSLYKMARQVYTKEALPLIMPEALKTINILYKQLEAAAAS